MTAVFFVVLMLDLFLDMRKVETVEVRLQMGENRLGNPLVYLAFGRSLVR